MTVIIRFITSRQREAKYNWCEIDNWAFRFSVFGLPSQKEKLKYFKRQFWLDFFMP